MSITSKKRRRRQRRLDRGVYTRNELRVSALPWPTQQIVASLARQHEERVANALLVSPV